MFSHCNKFYVGPTLFTLSLFIRLHTSLHRVDWRLPIFSFLILTSLSVCRGVFRTQSNIYDGDFCENSNKTLNHLAKLTLNDWTVFWALICMVHLTVYSVMSRTLFRVNPRSIVAWMSRNSLLEAGAKSEGEVTATGFEPRTT